KLSSVSFSSTFALTLLVSEGPTSVDAGASTHYAYELLVAADAPVSYWRLDDPLPNVLVSDDFSGPSGALQGRANWTKHPASDTDALVSTASRVRVGANRDATYIAQTALASADYAVSADVYVASVLATDQAGVIARASSSADTYYFAGFVHVGLANLPLTKRFELWRIGPVFNGLLGYADETLAINTTRRITLEILGSTVRASLDGTVRATATDTNFAAAGSAGLLIGYPFGNTQSESAGLHLDNFSVREANRARDSKAVNHGLYIHGVARSAAGALRVPNGSASFDGVDDYIEVGRQIANDFSIELWFKSSQGIGTPMSATQWHQTAGLVDASSTLATNDFGIGLRADGRILAGTGKTTCVLIVCNDDDQTLVSGGSTAYNDGAWHHVVFTRSKTLGTLTLYVDGALSSTLATGLSLLTLDASATLNIGRLQTPKNYFAGQIDEVAVYPSVLGAPAVLKHYQAGRF
ncbi:MAG TPA: LamG domain-containing protein, partial [Polyangiales bacterium]|nr:LamG domain-containing protein [Polyangiales bacterium]